MRIGLGLGISQAFSSGGPPPFNPALLGFTGWWRNFAAFPWTPTASAGSSGSNGDLAAAGTPVAGSDLDGLGTLVLNGTDQYLVAASATSSFVSTTAGAVVVMFEALSTVAAATDFYDDPSLFTDTGGNVGLVINASGVRAGVYNSGTHQTPHIACSAGWHMAAMRWDANDVRCRLDMTDAIDTTPGPTGGIQAFSGTTTFGRNYTTAKLANVRITEILIASSLTDGNLNDLYASYFKVNYPSASLP